MSATEPRFTWRMLSAEEVKALEPTPEEQAYEKRRAANQRFQCGCGRFVKASTIRHRGMWGDLTWECSLCGTCRG